MTEAIDTATSIVTESEWKQALEKVTTQEDALYDQLDAVSAARHRLPMTEITEPFTFQAPDGEKALADLFDGKRYLTVYHVMFAPEWDNACPGCTGFVNGLGDTLESDLAAQGVQLALISRASVGKLTAYKAKTGWTMPWYSADRSFSEYIGTINDEFGDVPGVSVFARDEEGKVYRSYFSNGRIIEPVTPFTAFMNLTPLGVDSPEGDN